MKIDATGSIAIGSPIANSNAEYATTNGVFFNPSADADNAELVKVLPATISAWGPNNEANAADNIPGSVGTALYYDRTTGVSKDLIRTIDTGLLINEIYSVYGAVCTGYDSAVTSYEASRKTYEAGTNTVRPDKPTAPAAYSGMTLITDNATTTSANWTTLKAATTNSAYLRTAAPSTFTGTDAEIAKIGNAISYLQISADDSVTYVDQTVSHAFGKLGQDKTLGITAGATPFIWQKTALAKVPGVQISLFPEPTYSSTDFSNAATTVSYANPTIVAGDVIEINLKAVNAATISVPATTGSPTAITEPTTTGAQALAASLIAAVTVATTLF